MTTKTMRHLNRETKRDRQIEVNSKAQAHRVLIIRLSSFGDIVQALSVPAAIHQVWPDAKIDWFVRADFKPLLRCHAEINSVIAFDRKEGFGSLLRLSWRLGAEPYTHIYDAHNNLRSQIIVFVMLLRRLMRIQVQPLPKLRRRPKDRLKRFLFFKARLRRILPMPFRGIESFLKPLAKWQVETATPLAPQFFIDPSDEAQATRLLADFHPEVALVPSAAWEMKRWPVDYWKRLIELLPNTKFVVLGGPEDLFCKELEALDPARVRNLAGQLNLQGSSAVLQKVKLVISGDTGLLHVSDQLGRPTLALIGPTAFGYPSHPESETIETQLTCKPCSKDGRGHCVNAIYKKCLLDLTPELVAERAKRKLQPRGYN